MLLVPRGLPRKLAQILTDIVQQLRRCDYSCEGGPLVNNEAFRELERLAQEESHAPICPVADSGEIVAMTPGFEKPAIGDVVAVEAVDWGQIVEEVSGRSEFTLSPPFSAPMAENGVTEVHGAIYGKVVACDDERISLAFQVFDSVLAPTGADLDGNLRGVLSVPWVTISKVTILQKAN